MFEEERLHKISKYVQEQSRASVQELCSLFQVSESTIRRDLSELENRNLLKRTHGGAVYLQPVGFEPSYREKEDRYRSEKAKIAKKAAEFIQEGDTLIVDAGTTTLYLTQELAQFKELTIITNSIILLQKLSGCKGLQVMSTGGILRENTMALVGPGAEDALDRFRVDKAFMATNGFDLQMGFTTPNLLEASTKQKMMRVAEQVYVLADHSKVGHVSFAKFGTLADVDGLITGDSISDAQKTAIEKQHTKLYLVSADEVSNE